LLIKREDLTKGIESNRFLKLVICKSVTSSVSITLKLMFSFTKDVIPLPRKNVKTVNPNSNKTKVTLTMEVIFALMSVRRFILCFLAIHQDYMEQLRQENSFS